MQNNNVYFLFLIKKLTEITKITSTVNSYLISKIRKLIISVSWKTVKCSLGVKNHPPKLSNVTRKNWEKES